MWPYNQFGNPFFPGSPLGGSPFPFTIPGSGGTPPSGGTGTPGWLGTLGGIIGDVGDILNILFPNRNNGGGSGGGTAPSPLPPAVAPNVSSFADPAARQAALDAMNSNPSLLQKFIDFMGKVGVIASVLQQMMTASIFEWPSLLQDIALMWLAYSQPTDPSTGNGKLVADTVPIEATSGGSSLPVPVQPGIPSFGNIGGFMQPVLPAVATTVYRAPKGYVTITHPQTGQKAFVLKTVAKAMGLYKTRVKAPVTGAEWRAAKKAKAIEAKLARMMGDSCNYKVTKKRCR